MREKFIEWLESHLETCAYKKYLGFECPGCGLQRSFIELLKGNFAESFQLFPALMPILFMFFYLIAHLIFNFKKGADVLKYLFIFNVGIVIIHYIFKLIH
jgi:hypothetical protein